MSLSASDIASIKTYINQRYSANQLIKWTNPDTIPIPSTIDDDTYTAMIESAYQMYLSYYSQTFAVANYSALDKLCMGVILTMQSWRKTERHEIIEKFYTSLKVARIKQMQILPLEVDNMNIRHFNKRDPDSSDVSYLGRDTGANDDE